MWTWSSCTSWKPYIRGSKKPFLPERVKSQMLEQVSKASAVQKSSRRGFRSISCLAGPTVCPSVGRYWWLQRWDCPEQFWDHSNYFGEHRKPSKEQGMAMCTTREQSGWAAKTEHKEIIGEIGHMGRSMWSSWEIVDVEEIRQMSNKYLYHLSFKLNLFRLVLVRMGLVCIPRLLRNHYTFDPATTIVVSTTSNYCFASWRIVSLLQGSECPRATPTSHESQILALSVDLGWARIEQFALDNFVWELQLSLKIRFPSRSAFFWSHVFIVAWSGRPAETLFPRVITSTFSCTFSRTSAQHDPSRDPL